MQSKHFLIAGAGIAGLSHALALCRSGHRVQVLEQSAQLQAVGAGIQLGPNALRRLDQLGLLATLLSKGAQPNAVAIRSLANGRLIKKLDLRAIKNRYDYPVLCIHRAALQQTLLDACMDEAHFSLLTNKKLESVKNTKSGVLVQTAAAQTAPANNDSKDLDSSNLASPRLDSPNLTSPNIYPPEATQIFAADALIAADGLWSRTRQQIIGDGPPNPTGKIAFRAVMPLDALTGDNLPDGLADQTGLWLGANAHLVHYPVGESGYTGDSDHSGDSAPIGNAAKQLNIIVMMRGNNRIDHWQQASTKTLLLQQLQLAHPQNIASVVRHLLNAIPECSAWTLFDRPVINRWHDGNICLTGDAAHPMQAHLAQGASMAIEDALTMTTALNTSETMPAAFAKFNAQRLDRTSHAMRKAKQYGNIYQASWPVSFARDCFLKSPVSSWNAAGMDWLYRG